MQLEKVQRIQYLNIQIIQHSNPLLQNRIVLYILRLEIKMIGIDIYNDRSNSIFPNKKVNQSSSKLNIQKSLKHQGLKQLPPDFHKIIQNDIKKANELIQKIHHELIQERIKSNNNLIADLREIEQSIRRKNFAIYELQKDVNFLKNGNNRSRARMENFNFSLNQQMKYNSAQIIDLRKELSDKKKSLASKWHQIRDIQQRYSKKCQKQRKQMLSFAKFRQHQERKKKQQLRSLQKNRNNSNNRRYISSSINDNSENERNINSKSESIRDYTCKRNVAQGAVKNERKKHKQEMQNLTSKLDFLKDQDAQLQQKIRLKKKELQNAQKRFSESRNNYQNSNLKDIKQRKPTKFKTIE